MENSSTLKLDAATDVVHYFQIHVKKSHGSDTIEYMVWSDMTFEIRCKYTWYFKYRAALLQIKYPKYLVDTSWGNVPAQGRSLIRIVQAKLIRKKGTVTEYKNKLRKAEENWNQIFPITDDIRYQNTLVLIAKHEAELNQLDAYYKSLINTNP